MPATERELADDAHWKVIQKNTFTRWVNERLKVVHLSIQDLEFDLSDGLRLAPLIEVLSRKKLPRYNKNPSFRTQKLENITTCLTFLEEKEGIRLVSIDSAALVDGNLKLILGLIWTLILHYSIAASDWEDDELNQSSKEATPKQRLLAWIQSKIPERKITNFTSDWNNGVNIGALVDALAPGLCPDWKGWNPSNPVPNATIAMDAAEKWMDVPQLIKPSEMCNPKVDEQSMMTYLSQFPNAKVRPDAPTKSKSNPGRCRAYGPGLEGGHTLETQTFAVDTNVAGNGSLNVAIEGPSEAKVSSRQPKDGLYTIDYVPPKAGEYIITVTFSNQHIPGSPFRVRITDAFNPQAVRCYGPGLDSKGIRKGQPALFTADATEAGTAVLEVLTATEKGQKKAAQINPRGDGIFDVVYYPDIEGPYQINVFYGGKPVKGSPFRIVVLPSHDPSRVVVSGDGVKPRGVPASLPVSFNIDTRDAGLADLDVSIKDPQGNFVRPKVLDSGMGTYVVTYVPADVGKYKIIVMYGGQHAPGSPFIVEVGATGDASKVKILDGLRDIIPVGEESKINLSTAGAGNANVTCPIHSSTGQDVDVDIVDHGQGNVSVSYVPQVPGAYTLNMKYGGQPIPKGQFTQKAVDPKLYLQLLEQQRQKPTDYQPVDFFLPTGPEFGQVSALITTPSGKRQQPKLEDNRDGSVKVIYQPEEEGRHRLDVFYNKYPIQGSPFSFYVNAVDPDHVIAYGPGLSYGFSKKPCQFIIVYNDNASGGIGLSIEGPSKALIEPVDNRNGTCSVSYLPTVPGEYTISVLYDKKHIAGSPFTPKILAPVGVDEKTRLSVGKEGEVPLWLNDEDLSSLTATVRSPSGKEEPCHLNRLSNGYLGLSFTPREVGEHLVSILRFGKHIPNSPFKIYVDEGDLGNAGRVKVYGPGLDKGFVNSLNQFFINSTEAGFGGLSLAIEGPSKADIKCEDDDDEGLCTVTYKPTEPGRYIITIKFADQHVPGSPFLVNVAGKPFDRITERIVRQQDAADVANIGSQCDLSLKIPDTKVYDLEASVSSPSGSVDRCDVRDTGDERYCITFVPRELGVHLVTVKHRKVQVPGSPFKFTVGPILDGGANKVRAIGPGLDRGEILKPSHFNVYTREAGIGSLALSMEGPSKAEIDFKDCKDGSCEVSYICTEPGDYQISIKFNDSEIPDSPFRVYVSPSAGHTRLLDLHGAQDLGLQKNKPAAFALDLKKIEGILDARVVAPSSAEDHVIIQEIETNRYAIRFIPRENGAHFIHVRHNGQPVTGSPFRVLVGDRISAPGTIRAQGDGLVRGVIGQTCKFLVTAKDTGEAALAVTVDGPSKVQLSCKEVAEGYEFSYTPTKAGEYVIHIKQAGNNHVPGSPFKAVVQGHGLLNGVTDGSEVTVETVTRTSTTQKFSSSAQKVGGLKYDASKVTASGDGLRRALVNKETIFTVDAANAGSNSLMVGVTGPKLPCEQVNIQHLGQSKYRVSYTVHDPDTYTLNVKWGDQHIPGSPFQVVAN